MARTFVSPMGDPTFANAANSLAEALFPNARAQAAAKMAGAQYQGQLASNEQTGLENVGLRRSNTAYDQLPALFDDPRLVAILQAGGGNADQLMGAIGKDQEQTFRQGARDAAVAGNQQQAVNELFGVASGPVRLNDIDSGYQLNPYQSGGPIAATGETLSEIVANQARAGASNAAANASNARAGYYTDRTTNPERHRAAGGKDGGIKVSPSDAANMDKLLGYYLPAEVPDEDGGKLSATMEPGLRNAVLTRATEIFSQNQNAQLAVDQAVQEMLDIKPGTPGADGFFRDTPGVAPSVSRRAPAAAAPAAAPAAGAPMRARNPQTGEVLELRNGQWVKVQ